MAERLDLSDQQRQDIEEIMQAGADQVEADRARMEELRAAMHELVADFDAGEAQQLADEMGEISARMSYQRVENRAAVYQLLDENQRAELESMQEQKQERSGKRHSRKR